MKITFSRGQEAEDTWILVEIEKGVLIIIIIFFFPAFLFSLSVYIHGR